MMMPSDQIVSDTKLFLTREATERNCNRLPALAAAICWAIFTLSIYR